MNQAKQFRPDQEVALDGSMVWSQGTLIQGKRLLSATEKLIEHKSMFLLTTEPYVETLRKLNDDCSYETYFFVHALYYLTFHLERASKSFSGFKSFFDKIEKTNGSGYIKDIRDMHTHIDEYAKGTGRAQGRFIHKFTYAGSPTANGVDCDAITSVVLHDDGNLIIGGRIDVQKTMQTIEELLPEITNACQKEWESVYGPLPKT